MAAVATRKSPTSHEQQVERLSADVLLDLCERLQAEALSA